MNPYAHRTLSRTLLRAAALGLALTWAALAAPALAQGEAAEVGLQSRVYPLRSLRPLVAEVLVWEQCPKDAGDRCRVTHSGISEAGPYIGVVADVPTHARIARVLAQHDSVPTTRRFHILLLVADSNGTGMPEGLPPGAAKALEDLRGFLPYTRYGVVDFAWVQTADDAEAALTGPDGLPIEVGLSFENRLGDELYVDAFRLRAPSVPPRRGEGGEDRPGRSHPQQLLVTSFSMTVGETVVVGTSKLDGGGEALVTLVTAVP